MNSRPPQWKKRRKTQSPYDDRALQNPVGTGRQARGLRDREHGGFLRSVRLYQPADGAHPLRGAGQAVGRPPGEHHPPQHAVRDAAQRPRGADQHHPGTGQRAGHPAHPHLQPGRPHHALHRSPRAQLHRRARPAGAGVRIIARPRRASACWQSSGPSRTRPTCSNAACHVHPAGQQIARDDRRRSVAGQVDAQMAQHQATLQWFLVGAILFGCGAGGRCSCGSSCTGR